MKYQILRCLRSASNYSNLVWFCFRWLALPSWAIICEFTTWCLKSCLLSLPWDFSNLWHFDPKSGPLSKHIYVLTCKLYCIINDSYFIGWFKLIKMQWTVMYPIMSSPPPVFVLSEFEKCTFGLISFNLIFSSQKIADAWLWQRSEKSYLGVTHHLRKIFSFFLQQQGTLF